MKAFFDVYPFLLFIGLMCIPAYFIARFALTKLVSDERRRRAWLWPLTVLLSTVLCIVTLCIVLSILFYEPTYDFEQAKWNAIPEERWQMADDILDRKLLNGKDTIELKRILGEPKGYWTAQSGDLNWEYDLGSDGWNFHLLHLRIQGDKVIGVEHTVTD